MNQKAITGILGGVCVLLAVLTVLLYLGEDKKGPKIQAGGEDLSYIEGEGTEALLQDMTAYDEKDKDVTASLIVESVVPLSDGVSAKVVYAAKDHSNNISRLERVAAYTAAGSAPETEDSDSRETETQKETEPTEETETTVSTEPLVSTGVPVIRLNTHKVTLKVGEEFHWVSYVDDAVDDVDDASARIRVNGEFDMSTAGTYELSYYVVDSDGNESNVEKLTLVVEE